MWSYHPDLLAAPVPRYTSYPTAAEFDDDVGGPDLVAALAQVTGEVSVYVHIPFCETICWYCGCNTGRANRGHRLTTYLEALHREVSLVGQLLPKTAYVRRISFGGGSPNAIAPADFVRLFLSLTDAFHLDDPLVSVELDPRTLTAGWARAMAGIGVHNASLGVQTFDARLQQAIGRIQPVQDIERCTSLLREAGITSLNYDLMYGLPGQTEDQLAATLTRAVEFGADRIALFGYAHVPHLIARQRRINADALPDQDTRFRLAMSGYQFLTQHGYIPVGFDHFALPDDPLAQAATNGRLHRNFQGFTDDEAPVLIGLGASAISSFPGLLIQNEKNAGRYRMMLSQDHLPGSRGIRRNAEDQRCGGIIEALLCHGRVELPLDMRLEAESRLRRFAAVGIVRFEGDMLVIPPEALPYARTIAAVFDPYRHEAGRKFSSAV
ncbi:oxygen-independent coproporphyrinogen III oxidase [Sphingobium olei]|uniref:Coproporphyrinogen-III oxidase n=1 Tax=Sphingobium olei TaxID=420955 RepID=A0ABW3NZ82_9SPHN